MTYNERDKGKRKVAVGYVRVSTEQQMSDERYGVDVQKEGILKYAYENGYEIIDWKIDDVSGAKDDRPALNELLYKVDNPPIEAVIVFKNDRLARDMKLYFYYLYTLEKRNVRLISVEEDFGISSDLANIYRALLQFVAEQERKNIALRTGRGREQKAKYGGYSGGRCPYGYRVEHGQLLINEPEVEIVKYIFENRDKGVTMLAIADGLRDLGYKTRKGTYFQVSTVKNIIENRKLYEGMYKYGNMNWVQGVHEPILKK